jgi:hypothetical protein
VRPKRLDDVLYICNQGIFNAQQEGMPGKAFYCPGVVLGIKSDDTGNNRTDKKGNLFFYKGN